MASIYVAAPFSEWPLVREVQASLRQRGHTITWDWTQGAERYANDAACTDPAARSRAAALDLFGVAQADIVLVLTVADPAKGLGMWIECGAALAQGKRVIVIGPRRGDSIFFDLASCTRCEALAEALACLDTEAA